MPGRGTGFRLQRIDGFNTRRVALSQSEGCVSNMEGKETMINHGMKWGWRRLAARFLLAPLLAAGLTVPVSAQSADIPAQARPAGTTAEQLLQMGRASLEAGQFDKARDYARQALAKKPANGWGYFSDSPEKLVKDVAAKKIELGKMQGDQFMKMAKQLMEQPARTPAEKLEKLDQAYNLADKAVAVSGSPDLLDGILSDTPTQLRNEIAKARTELRRTTAASPTQSLVPPTTVASATASSMMPTTRPATPTATRAQALRLMAEGAALKTQNRIIEAKNKAAEAAQLNAPFAATEYNPTQLLNDLSADAQDQLTSLMKGAEEYIDRKEFRRAEASLGIAMQLAEGMKLPTETIQSRYDEVQQLKDGKTIQVAAEEPAPAPMPLTVPTIEAPQMPTLTAPEPMNPVVPSISVPNVPSLEPAKPVEAPKTIEPPLLGNAVKIPPVEEPMKPVVVPSEVAAPLNLATPQPKTLTGEMLLNQAKAELRRGDLDMARKLAIQAYTSDERIKPVAQDLLRQVDAEVMTRKRDEASKSLEAAAQYLEAKRFEQSVGVLTRIDPNLLSDTDRRKRTEMFQQAQTAMNPPAEPIKVEAAKVEAAKVEAAKVETAKVEEPKTITVAQQTTPAEPKTDFLTEHRPGRASSGNGGHVEYEKLRSEGFEGRGRRPRCLQQGGHQTLRLPCCQDYAMRVKQSSVSAIRQERLLRTDRTADADQLSANETANGHRDQRDQREAASGFRPS